MDTLGQYFERRYIQISSLARTAGVPASTLYKYTSGRSSVWNMSIHTFSKLAHALGMTTDEFIEELQAIENGHGPTD